MRIDHTCLNVRDMDRAIQFWTRNFDMKELYRREIPENNAEIAYVGYGDDQAKIELSHWRDWKTDDYVEGTLFDHVALVVDDVQDLVERLRHNQVEIAKEPYKLSGGRSIIAFVKDHEGNWIELIQR